MNMKAIIWDGRNYPEGLRFGNFPIPEPEENWIQYRPRAVGICGSDVHAVTGHTRHLMPDKNFPAVLGHESAGVITRLGANVKGFQVGDRVAIEPLCACTDFGNECQIPDDAGRLR